MDEQVLGIPRPQIQLGFMAWDINVPENFYVLAVITVMVSLFLCRIIVDSPFDFRTATQIGARINARDEQIGFGGGYDHNFVLREQEAGTAHPGLDDPVATALVARVTEPVSGRVLEVETSEPGLQFYSGNFLSSAVVGKGGRVYDRRSGFCLETQHFPDSPNKPAFPPAVLRPGEEYRSRTVYRFGIAK